MSYYGRHERKGNTSWVVTSWLLTLFFVIITFASLVSGPDNYGWLVWAAIGGLWLTVAVKETIRYRKGKAQA